jgi:hypothetical protein
MFGSLLVLEKKAPTAPEDAAKEAPVTPTGPLDGADGATGDSATKSSITLRERLRARLAQMTNVQKSGTR